MSLPSGYQVRCPFCRGSQWVTALGASTCANLRDCGERVTWEQAHVTDYRDPRQPDKGKVRAEIIARKALSASHRRENNE